MVAARPVVDWVEQLNAPAEAGKYVVKDYGIVLVTPDDVRLAKELGGCAKVELLDVTTFGDRINKYLVSRFIPA